MSKTGGAAVELYQRHRHPGEVHRGRGARPAVRESDDIEATCAG
jgi:hypothetical protein